MAVVKLSFSYKTLINRSGEIDAAVTWNTATSQIPFPLAASLEGHP